MKNYWKIAFILSSVVFLSILYRVIYPVYESTVEFYNSEELKEIPKVVSPQRAEVTLTKEIALSKNIKVDFPWKLTEQKDRVLSFENGVKAWITKTPDYSPLAKHYKSESEFIMKVLNSIPMKPSFFNSLDISKVQLNISLMNIKKMLVHRSGDCSQFEDNNFAGYFCKHSSSDQSNKLVTHLHVFSNDGSRGSVMLIDGNEGESIVALDAVRSIIGSLRLAS